MAAATVLAFALPGKASLADDEAACQASYVAGQRRYKLEHDLLGGREQLLVCAKTCPDELRESCGRWLTEIAAEVPSIVVKALDAAGRDAAGVAIAVDGSPIAGYVDGSPIELNPGPHRLRVSRAGRPPVEQPVVLRTGEKLRVVDVWTEPPDKRVHGRRPVPAAAFVLAGISAAALASFGVFSIWTTVEYDQTSGCIHHCSPATRDPAFTAKTVAADASVGVGAAAFVAAGLVYLFRPPASAGITRGSLVAPWAAPGAMGVVYDARF